jgi:CRP/FNR family transcriptional regulator
MSQSASPTDGGRGGEPRDALLRAFPPLRGVDDPAWREALERAKLVAIPSETRVFAEGEPCSQYVFVLSGSTQVYKLFENGKQMLLYRVTAGQTCSLTTSVLFSGGRYPADAATEVDTRAVVLPRRDFHRAFDLSKGFRDFVCGTFGGHVLELIMLIESIVTRQVDVRLAKWLLDQHGPIQVSHRELAFELGTAREVVSRQLKEFASGGLVRLGRRSIAIEDQASLTRIAEGCGRQ